MIGSVCADSLLFEVGAGIVVIFNSVGYRIFRQIRPPFSQFLGFLGLPKCRRVLYAKYIHAYTFYKIGVPKSMGVLSVGVLSTGKYGNRVIPNLRYDDGGE